MTRDDEGDFDRLIEDLDQEAREEGPSAVRELRRLGDELEAAADQLATVAAWAGGNACRGFCRPSL